MDSSLLKDIQNGKKLRKAVTNDRSAPMVGSKQCGSRKSLLEKKLTLLVADAKSSGPSSSGPSIARPPVPGGGASTGSAAAAAAPSLGGGPQLGGLFANGMPTLRKTRGAAVSTGRGQGKYKYFVMTKSHY